MIDKWILEDINNHLSQRKRVVLLDPNGLVDFLLPIVDQKRVKILKTDTSNTQEWQRVKEELFLRFEAESSFKTTSDNISNTRFWAFYACSTCGGVTTA